MSGKNYFFTGIVIVLLIVVLGAIGVVYSISPPPVEDVQISFHFSEENNEFIASGSSEKLFSENGYTIKFSPIKGKASFAKQGFECKISCKK